MAHGSDFAPEAARYMGGLIPRVVERGVEAATEGLSHPGVEHLRRRH